MWLKAENAYLHQKETELDKLQLTLRSIGKDEDAIRNFLGLEGSSLVEGNLGKGGNSFSHPIPITYPDPANNEIPSSIRKDDGTRGNHPRKTGVHRWNSEHLASGCGKILVFIEIWLETQPICG
jgi:hypothetical protein